MNKENKPYNNIKVDKALLDLVDSGFEKDLTKIEMAALSLARLLKKDNPEVSTNIFNSVSNYINLGAGSLRGMQGGQPLPVDVDSQLEMIKILSPDIEKSARPILSPELSEKVNSFLNEREKVSILLEQGIRPSNSLLLIGMPGTGKTMLAKHIATALNKDLAILDLSSSISSLLGKTGSNLKKVLNYAKETGAVLLLDEFDAIAKRRDDNTDLGEIKRVVNVLLMELENWPISSVVIATSNHPELLDRAIWRRFDHVLEISAPEDKERTEILKKEIGDFLPKDSNSDQIIKLLNELLKEKSAADICKYSNNVKRRIILKGELFNYAALVEISAYTTDKKSRGKLCVMAKDMLGDSITLRDLANITGLSLAGVQHHVSKNNNNE